MSDAEQLGPRYQSAVKDAQGRFIAPHRAIGDLGGTGHVVCVDLKAGCGDVSGPRKSFAVDLECSAITR
ncbi:unnamed protein product [Clavelina lepadiformis]|uniref:Uncharacterized protein n=1 Tax=Clavelina lepadiformis TaxID=159417 RepID=A0ABP0FR17_CLALP